MGYCEVCEKETSFYSDEDGLFCSECATTFDGFTGDIMDS